MAAQRATVEKSVLSKQSVSSRRKKLPQGKSSTKKTADAPDPTPIRRSIIGVVVGALSLLIFLSLITFHSRDRVGPGFNNAIGPVGHAVAGALQNFWGVCAYLLPLAGLYAAMVLFLGSRHRRRWPQLLSAALLCASSCVLLDLAIPDSQAWGYPPGGWVGHSLSQSLCALFSTIGTVILVTAVSISALIVGTQFIFLKLCSAVWKGIGLLSGHGARGAAVFWDVQKKAYVSRREAAALAKLEEVAFLAQLEADEEESLDSSSVEQDLEEAEEVAEEIHRLSREDPAPTLLPVIPSKRSESAVPPMASLARMPLIVEPKAPPAPTKKKEPEDFEFVGGRKSFSLPPLSVLEADVKERTSVDKAVFLSTAEKLRAKLADFGIVGEVVEIRPGPVVTMYEFLPGPGIKISKIASLADDLAMAMEAMRVRIVAPIPGKGVVGIEVPNRDRETVFLKEIAEQDLFTKSASKLTMCIGKDIEGMPFIFDLAKAPHVLMAGTTGSGKSVAVNSMIMSILLKSTPEEVRFIMVDPKMLELSVYEGIPHLLLPVVTDPKKAALALRWAVEEMERRYHLLSEAGVRNISGYNKLVDSVQGDAQQILRAEAKALTPSKNTLVLDVGEATAGSEHDLGVPSPLTSSDNIRELELAAIDDAVEEKNKERETLKKLPYIVVIIDELADLMMVASREVETYIARLAQMARAAGIHLMVATQRPSIDVVTGIIKANFPTRISFMLRSKPDSMTILGTVGAEALLGMGDMLVQPPTSSHLQRVHGAYVSEVEIKRAVDHLKAQGKPVYDDSILKPRDDENEGGAPEDDLSDELYDQVLAAISDMKHISISMVQRKMRIGYNRAARMIERMEREGVVGPADGARPREVLIRAVGEMPGAGAN